VNTTREARAEQWIKEGKGAIKWTRLACRTFAANAVRLQLHALTYNLGNFLRTLATPDQMKDWSLTSLREKLIKIDAKVVSHGRYIAFQMAEVAIPRHVFAELLRLIAESAFATDLRADMTRLAIDPPAKQRERCVLTSPASAPMPRNVRQGPSASTEAAMAITGSAATTGKATRRRRNFRPIRWIPAKMRRRS